MTNKKVLAIIPARGGSKGIPKKNIVNCGNKPLIYWTAQAVLGSKLITDNLVSSDNQEIISISKSCGLRTPFIRPNELAMDGTPTLPVIQHALDWVMLNDNYKPDIIVILQPTSPLRKSHHIDEAIQKLIDHPEADSIVSITKIPHQYTPESALYKEDIFIRPCKKIDENNNIRQKKKEFYARNGAAIYGLTTNCILNKFSLYGDNTIWYEMTNEESIDIDTSFELKIANYLLTQNNISQT